VDVGRASWISEITGGKKLNAELLGSRKAVTTVAVAIDGEPLAIFSLEDELRPEARAVVSHLQDKMRVTTHMVTGDGPSAAESVATAVEIPQENVVSEALPWGKVGAAQSNEKLLLFPPLGVFWRSPYPMPSAVE